MAIYAIWMTMYVVNGKLVTLQPGHSQLFSENDEFIMKYQVDQTSTYSPSFIVFHYYLEGVVDVAQYTTTNALFNTEIKNLQLHYNFF